jgi:plastocyanin
LGAIQRSTLAAVAVLLVAGSTLPGLADPSTATHVTDCPDPSEQPNQGDEAEIFMGPLAATVSFTPECVTVDSGATVSFVHADQVQHPIFTKADGGECWERSTFAGDVVDMTLSYDGETVLVDGKPCPEAVTDRTQGHATVAIGCTIHPKMNAQMTVWTD